MEKYYLIKCNADYADEFDVDGFCIMNETDYRIFSENKKEFQEKYDCPIEVYFGTNEFLVFGDAFDMFRSITEKEITDTQFQALTDLGLESFGYIPAVDIIMSKDYIDYYNDYNEHRNYHGEYYGYADRY